MMRGGNIKQMLDAFVKKHYLCTVTNQTIQAWIFNTYNVRISGKKLVKPLNNHESITPIKYKNGNVKYFIRDLNYENFKKSILQHATINTC
jgi:hypothetical protein